MNKINKISTKQIKNMIERPLINIGFGNTVVADRVVAIVSPNSSPMKRLKDEAKLDKRIIDATHGRKTRSIIVTDSNHVILSAIQHETISQRFEQTKDQKKETLASINSNENNQEIDS